MMYQNINVDYLKYCRRILFYCFIGEVSESAVFKHIFMLSILSELPVLHYRICTTFQICSFA